MRSPRLFSSSTTFTVPSTAGPSSSEVISSAIDPLWRGVPGEKVLDRHDEGGDRGLHVGGAAPEELAFALGGNEGVAVPLVERPGGHDVGVARRSTGAGERSPRRAQRFGHLAALDRLDG